MPQFRSCCWLWLLAGSVALWINADSAQAQDDAAKPAAASEAEEAKDTPWPPPNTELHEIKRDESQGQGLKLYTPKTWKKGTEKKPLRLADFAIPPAAGDTEPVELTVFSFSGGAGGGVQANIDRWRDQFQAQGREMQIFTAEGKQGLYVLVDIKGTYNMSIGPPIGGQTKAVPNARMLAVIIGIRWEQQEKVDDETKTVTKSAVYFLKLAGPEKTITANEDAFRAAFGAASKDKENPFKVTEEPAK